MLTVLIATRNGAATLPRVLAAYTRLEPPAGGWKLVVVDNASRDGSAALVAAFAERLPLTLCHEPRPGKNRALNRGLREVAGDLVVFSDDDALPEPDWLVALRAAADRQPAYGIFAGRIQPRWDAEPPAWVRDWVHAAAVYCVSDPARADGPCEPTAAWGPNMAVRAEWFRRGYRFDERLGPNGSPIYAMGSETELTLRLALAEGVQAWFCGTARVHHVIRPAQLSRDWILRRAFRFGRGMRRQTDQYARAGQPFVDRGAATSWAGVRHSLADLVAARRAADARRAFEARWQLNFWCGCLFEALAGSGLRARRAGDGGAHV